MYQRLITFRILLLSFFLLECINLFGYTASIYFFFLFFFICYMFFSNILNVTVLRNITMVVRDCLSHIFSLFNILIYKAVNFLSFFFSYVLLKKALFSYKDLCKNFLLQLNNFFKYSFFLKYSFLKYE